jgi:hypothetical protein
MKCRPKTRRFLRHGSQCSEILKHLKAGRVLTTWIAFERFGCCRASERIRELRARGHRIHSTMVRQGSKRLAVYVMDLP